MAETWDVVDQQQRTRLMPGGRFADVIEVSFQTKPHGISGTVDVPLSQYSADVVRDLIQKRVDAMHEVHEL